MLAPLRMAAGAPRFLVIFFEAQAGASIPPSRPIGTVISQRGAAFSVRNSAMTASPPAAAAASPRESVSFGNANMRRAAHRKFVIVWPDGWRLNCAACHQ